MARRAAKIQPKQSKAELAFMHHWKQYGMAEDCDMPELQIEYQFHPTRKWRFDFAHMESMTAIEIDGGVWNKQKRGHTSGKGYTEDRIKDNTAARRGWLVLRYTPQMISIDPMGCIMQILEVLYIRSPEDPPLNK